MLRAAVYIRVSTEEQHLHGLSLDAQRDALTEYAKKNDMQIVDVYADEGITARKRLDKRLEFQRLMQDVRADKIDLILVTKLDRWFRNIKDYHNTQEILEAHKCNWKTIFENYDTSTAGGRLHINIMLAVNQDECDRTSERIKAVFKHKRENKEVTSHKHPRGFKVEGKHLVIDENTVQQPIDAFNWLEESGGNITAAHKRFCAVYGTIHRRNFKEMLQNERYIGKYRDIDDYCPAIISKEQFARVQRMIELNAADFKRENKYMYIFSKMLRCKDCGRTYVGTNTPKYRKGEQYRYKQYRCGKHHQSRACDNKYLIPETVLEKYLLANVQAQLKEYNIEYEIKKADRKKADNTQAIAALQKKCAKLKDLYLDDLIDKDTYKHDYEALKAQIEALQQEAPTEEKDNTEAIQAILQQDFPDIYKTLTDEEKRRVWLSIIDYIEIGHNKSDITIHFI